MSNYLTDHRIIAVSRPDKRINLFIQGGTTNSFTLPKDITAIEEYAFHNISGLTEVVFTNQDVVVEVDENSGIPANAKFIVPAKFLSDYEAKYPNRTVETRGVIWTVPFIGETTLTKAYINQCVLQEPEIVNAEVVIVPATFTSLENDIGPHIKQTIPSCQMFEWDGTFLLNPTTYESFNLASYPFKKLVFPNMSVAAYNARDAMYYLSDVVEDIEVNEYRYGNYQLYNGYLWGNNVKRLKIRLANLAVNNGNGMNASRIMDELYIGEIGPQAWFVFGLIRMYDVPELKIYIDNLNRTVSAYTQYNNNLNWERNSLVYTLEHASDMTSQGGATFTIGATNLAKLTQDEIDSFTAKGWTLQ